jgi:general secretion pathway protein C
VSVLSLQQADVFRLLQSGNTKWLIRGINLLLVVWIASLLASLTWSLVTPEGNSQLENIEAGPAQVVADPNAQLIRQLPGWHLMGVASRKQASVVSSTPVDAPDTRLKLVLRGVFASEESGKARAIIADPRGKEEHYAIGDSLPGNAELSEVYPDRVILQRNGRYETLRLLPDSTSRNRSARRPVVRSSGKTLAKKHEQRIRDIRQKIKQSPNTLIDAVRPMPHMGAGGVMVGYKLMPGRDPAFFRELGLQPGDVVVQINDVRLDSKQNGMRALKSIQSGDHASMTLLRDGQEQVVNLSMPE